MGISSPCDGCSENGESGMKMLLCAVHSTSPPFAQFAPSSHSLGKWFFLFSQMTMLVLACFFLGAEICLQNLHIQTSSVNDIWEAPQTKTRSQTCVSNQPNTAHRWVLTWSSCWHCRQQSAFWKEMMFVIVCKKGSLNNWDTSMATLNWHHGVVNRVTVEENVTKWAMALKVAWRLHFVEADIAVGWRCLVCVHVSDNSEYAKKLSSVIKFPHRGRLGNRSQWLHN